MDLGFFWRKSAFAWYVSAFLFVVSSVAAAGTGVSSCSLIPVAISESTLSAAVPGDEFTEISLRESSGNFSWLTWAGSPSSPVLANSLTLPGDSDSYVNPDDSSDLALHPGDWAQGAPGVTGSSAVKTALNALLDVPIVVPVWDEQRSQGNRFDYHVARFATVKLTGYSLGGYGWLSFTYIGEKNCFNTPPMAENQAYITPEDTPVSIQLAGEDVDGDPLSYSLVSYGSHGSVSGDAPDLVYTPASNFTGSDTFSYRVNDGIDDSAPANVAITVEPVNDAPQAFNQQLRFVEDTPAAVTLQWLDVDGDTVSVSILTQPLHGGLSGEGDSYVYTPDANFAGDDSFTFSVNDGQLDSNIATVYLSADPVNDAPVANSGAASTLEDEPVEIVLSASDVDGDVLSLHLLGQTAHGSLTFVSGNTVRYQPVSGYFGPDQFTFYANDGVLDSNVAQVDIDVIEKNKPPVIVSDAVTVASQGTPYTYQVEATDPNPDDTLSYALDRAPQGMTIESATGLVQWQPMESYVSGLQGVNRYCALTSYDEAFRALDLVFLTDVSGSVVLPASLLDPLVTDTETALADLAIGSDANPNRFGLLEFADSVDSVAVDGALMYPASAYADATSQLVAAVGGSASGLAAVQAVLDQYGLRPAIAKQLVLAVDDIPADVDTAAVSSLAAALVGGGYRLSVIVDVTYHCESGETALAVDAGNNGYVVRDGKLEQCNNPVLVSGNDAVLASYVELALASGGSVWNLSRLQADQQVFGQALGAYLVDATIDGFSVKLADLVVQSIALDPNNPLAGTVRVHNRGLGAPGQAVTLQLAGLSGEVEYPLLSTVVDNLGAAETALIPFTLPQGHSFQALRASLAPLPGEVECAIDNNTLTAPLVTARVEDEEGLFDQQQYAINVYELNDPPSIISDPGTTAQVDADYTYYARAADTDRGDLVRFSLLEAPAGMWINPVTGKLTWHPLEADRGEVPVTVQVTDIAGATADQAFTISVGDLNHSPTIVTTPLTTAQLDQLYFYDVNATDPDVDVLAYSLLESPAGAVINPASGEIQWQAGSAGVVVFGVQVSDGRGGFDSQQFEVTVSDGFSNSAPVALPDSYQTGQNQLVDIALRGTDPDGDVLAYSIASQPQHGTLSGEGADLRYLPDAYYAGADSFEFVVDDGRLGSLPATISVEVTDQNNPPIITSEPDLPFVLEPATGQGEPVDLSTWTPVILQTDGQPLPNWVVSSDHTLVNQTVNARASAFLSEFDVKDDQMSGILRVYTTSDDDFIGFVFGYQNPFQFYLFDWKKNAQSGAERGMSVKVINLNPDGSEGRPILWASNNATIETLYHNSILWYPNTDYNFTLDFHPGEFTITVKQGAKVIDAFTLQDDTFSSGLFGFYNYSQQYVRYRGFTREVLASREYVYDVEAMDPDGDDVTFTLLSGPEGMTQDPVTGVISWQTTSADAGSYDVVVEASDPYGASTTQRYQLVVVEQVPVITTDPEALALTDQAYAYDVDAFDPQPDDTLTYSLTESPAGMSIDPLIGLISWQPGIAEIGPHNVTVRVTDTGGYYSEQNYTLSVEETPPNEAPTITSQAPAAASVGSFYSYSPSATDPDGDPVTFSLIKVPNGVQMFDGKTITWWPTADQVTQHDFILEASDGRGGAIEQHFTVDVTGYDVNHAPEISSQPGNSIQSGGSYEYRVIATDVDGDILAYTLLDGPPGMTLDELGVVRWTPADSGYYNVALRVEDGRGGYTTQTFQIAVYSSLSNGAPVLATTPVTAAYIGTRYEYSFQASDPDGDSIVYSVLQGPVGMEINASSGLLSWVPGEQDLGEHSVTVQAYDGRGGATTQSFPLSVQTLSDNTPPDITSTPATAVAVGAEYTYQVVAVDAEGDSLQFALEAAPAGMTIDAQGAVAWVPGSDQAGLHTVAVKVSDDAGGTAVQSYTLAVDDGTGLVGNLPPVISSSPASQADAGATYSYQVQAADPEGSALTYQLVGAPASATIDAGGLLSWSTTGGDIGSHSIVIEVADAEGAAAQQQFTVSILGSGGNRLPQIGNTPPASAKVGLEYHFQLQASDPDGDTLSFSLPQAGPGASISPTGLLTWTPAAAGQQPTTLRVSDGIQWTDLSWNIEVASASTALGATINVDPEVVDAGEDVLVEVIPTGSAGAATASITLDGVDVALGANLTATLNVATIGAHDIVARIEDGYDTAVVRKTFYVRDPDDTSVPTVTLENLQSGQEVTAPIDIVASIADDNLDAWSLKLYSRADMANPQELAAGTGAVSSAVIGTLDPTLLRNGQYTLQLEAWDASRNTGLDSHTVLLTGDMKVGNFSFTLTDLDIPVSGIPIVINRTYDSRDRQRLQDFGYGWSLDYQNVKVEESRKIAENWAINEYRYGAFNAYTNYCVEPIGRPLVTVTLPSGKVETFEVHASPECLQFQVGVDVEFDFVPVDGTTSTLVQTDYGLLRYNNGQIIELGGDQNPDPQHYVLTTKEGYKYVLDQDVGIKTVTDPNGNTLTYTDNGIFHSDGKSVLFERNAEGLVTAVVDPMGNRYEYTRDGSADLVAMTDPLGNESSYSYNASHGLLEMFDALGRKLIKNIYDDDGRLIAQEDGDGNRTEFNHDIAGRQSIVTNRRGYSTQYYYDDEGNVTSMVDALGNLTSYTFDADGNQTSQTDALGHTSSATYNDRADQLTQTDELGNTVRFTYNSHGQELTVKDARGNTYTQTYDGLGNLLTVKDPLGNLAGNNIDAKGNVTLTQDVEENITTFTYDGEGNKLTERDAEHHTTTYTYDGNGNVLTESITRGGATETTSYVYDDLDRLVETTDAAGNVTATEYDAAGNEAAMVDGEGRRTEYVYDAYGRLGSTSYPDGTTESHTYDTEGNRTSTTDRLGRTTSYSYDALNRLVQTTYPDGSISATEYDDVGRVNAEIDANGNRTEYDYDAAGRRIATTDAQGNVHRFEYDADGNLTAEVDALNRRTEYVYNALDQRTETRFHDGSVLRETQDALGRRTDQTDQAGIVTDYAYDGVGRLTAVTDALDGVTAFTYDSAGNKRTQADAEGRTTSWTYDALGRVIARSLPMGQSESFQYDGVGNVIERVDFKGQVTASTYDSNDRLVSRSYDDGSAENFSYDAVGNLLQVVQTAADASTRTTTYSYDSRDRLVSTTQPNGAVLAYGYDGAGNRTSLTATSPSGAVTVTSYGFDSLNRLQTVTDSNGITSYGYDAVGNLTSVSHPNGTSQVYSYDSLNRLTTLKTYDGTGALVEQYDYTLDPTGRRTAIAELDGRSTAYGYDDLYRLTSEVITDSVNGNYSASYQYDGVGNRIYETVDGVQTQYSYDANDRLTQQGGTTYSYDANGNTLAETLDGVTTSYSYDAKDRLVEMEQGGQLTSYAYDVSGIRNQKTEGGVTTDYVVDSNRDYAQVLEEVAGGSTVASYSYGHDLLSQDRAGASSFYLYDGLGSTRMLSDDLGSITDEYDYEAFGQVVNQSGTTESSYLFAGEQFDSGLDQYYLRARYYNQASGRFTQMDTWMGINQDPISLHRYLYANTEPANHIDPTGHFTLISTIRAITVAGSLYTAAETGYQFGSLIDRVARTGEVLTVRNGTSLGLIALNFLPMKYLAKVGNLSAIARKLEKAGFDQVIFDTSQNVKGFNRIFHWVQQMEQRGFDIAQVIEAATKGAYWIDTKTGAIIRVIGDAKKSGSIKVVFNEAGKLVTVLKDKLTNKVVPFSPIN